MSQEFKLRNSKLQIANTVYRHAVLILFACFANNLHVCIENPQRSWLWAILAAIVREHPSEAFRKWYFALFQVNFDACMFGHSRDKATRLLTSCERLTSMAITCDKSHKHSSWGITADGTYFATAQEAEYAPKFCKAFVTCMNTLTSRQELEDTCKAFRLDSLRHQGEQSVRHPQLISDFAQEVTVTNLPTDVEYKLLSSPNSSATGAKKGSCNEFRIGIYRTPLEHLNMAGALRHPMESTEGVNSNLRIAVAKTMSLGKAATAKKRLESLEESTALARKLAEAETHCRSAMAETVKAVTKGKRLELFRKLLEEVRFEDMKVVDFMKNGVTLTGWEPESELFAKKWNPPSLTVEYLDATAAWRREVMKNKAVTPDELQNCDLLWTETAKEVELGYLEGPYTEAELDSLFGFTSWSSSRRFLLLQGEEKKPRVIDDFSMSAVNEAFGSSSYLDLHDVEFLSSSMVLLARVGARPKNSDLSDILCSPRQIFRDKTWPEHMSFVGRGVDLSKAYKQIAVHPSSRRHAVVAVRQTCKLALLHFEVLAVWSSSIGVRIQ